MDASDCIAVGSYEVPVPGQPGNFGPAPLAEKWDGATWTMANPVLPADTFGTFASVSCPGGAGCIAAGYEDPPGAPRTGLVQEWDGSSWTALPAPAASLSMISCTSALWCAALGTGPTIDGSPQLADSWNGSSWSPMALPQPLPDGSMFGALSCASTSACLAVGRALFAGTLAMAWNGATWTLSRAGRLDELTGVWCARPGRCTAVGGFISGSDEPAPLTEAQSGTSWKLTRFAGGRGIGTLNDVSCTRPDACLAVGGGSIQLVQGLEARWDGRRWVRLQGPAISLAAISCVHGGCLATGGFFVATWWNGSHWRLLHVPLPQFTVNGDLADVSCVTAARCVLIGTFDSEPCCLASEAGSGLANPAQAIFPALVEIWNGTKMRLLTPAFQGMTSVSCVSASFCMAVSPDSAEFWTGGRAWRATRALPGGFPGLVDVSCTSTTACLAVGDHRVRGRMQAVAFAWNGTAWRRLPSPGPRAFLSDVWCTSATYCVAVGLSYRGTAATLALAELWNGNRWRAFRTVSP
jgi:hypothetical protein